MCAFLAALASVVAAQAAIVVEVAPDPVVADQSCRITFRADDADVGEPDFAPLEKDFEIIGRNRQSSLEWTNGRRSQSTTWVLDAMPRRGGTLTIPPVRFGQQESPARTVEAVAGAPGQATTRDADIILQAEATPLNPYVQQQVIYTVRLLHRVELSSPRFSPLETSVDAVVKPLGDGRQYRTQVNGVSYDAFEQRYAIFPQQSGALTVAPLALTTQVVRGVRSLFDPFSQSLQTRRVQSEAVELDVRPVPAAFPAGATWLPARRLRLHEEWDPDAPRADAGTPIARTLFLWADGLVAGQLPAVTPAAPDGTKLYPDQAQTNEQDTATGFTAVRQQKVAIIAGQPGPVTFAALTLPWWNTETDTLEQAELPARTIAFSGAATTSAAPTPTAPAPPALATPAADSTTAPAPSPAAARPAAWMAATAVLAVLWLATLFAWWRSRARRTPGGATDSDAADVAVVRAASAASALKSACGADDPAAARDALLAWGASRGGSDCRNLRELVARIETVAFAEAVLDLERTLYGRHAGQWRGMGLWDAFRLEPRRPSRAREQRRSPAVLPGLAKLAGN
ncbi:MAG: BatD family protein [Gammaproteobacteria bacterium]